jgi:hypothetical protein
MPIHHGRPRSFEPNTYREVRSQRRDDRDDFMERGGQPGGSTHYYADRTDRGRFSPAPQGYGFEDEEPPVERRGERPRGRGPHYGKGPQGFRRSDERIKELVCEALFEDDQIDATGIAVDVQQGEVMLAGTVDDRLTKRMAEDCAASIAGVHDVHNQLRIRIS